MAYVAEEKRVGRYLVRVESDDDYSLEDCLGDEPVYLFGNDRGFRKIADQSKRNFPSFSVLKAICEDDTREVLNLICDCRSSDWQWRGGKCWAEHSDWQRGRYFKTEESACAAMFLAEYGRKMSDLNVESFHSQTYQSGATYYLAFWQSELDAYAGTKNAESCISSCQSIVDGDVYGFVISGPYDEDGEESEDFDDHLDSCWGFIGESDYCLSEGESAAQYLENEALAEDAARMAESIAESRPDMSFPA